jgi:hypothetical protein
MTIPIEVPPFHGLEPKLALTHSSQGGNGFVGVGWTLSGISTIERVNSALGTPRFDTTDTYILDGQELIPCPETGSVSPSCTAGGTHSTNIESYLRIRFDSAANTWSVWGKDGTRSVLSPTFAVPGGGTLRWGQTSRVDTSGNTVAYQWACPVPSEDALTTTLLPAAPVEMDSAWWGGVRKQRFPSPCQRRQLGLYASERGWLFPEEAPQLYIG